MSHLSYGEVVPHLLREVPELEQTLAEHVRNNGQMLPHVFFADVTRYVHSELSKGRAATVRRILAVLESAITSDAQEARDLVGASFLENLESEPIDFAALSALAGPEMRKALAQERSRKGIEPPKSN